MAINETPPGPFIVLSSVDSTNNYAMAQVHAGMASHGMAVFAREQTSGKGQRGRQWLTEPGENLILSTILDSSRLQGHLFLLSELVALACLDLFKNYAGEETTIKWPNDLFWRDRKAGGILIENVLQGPSPRWTIAGTGININQVQFGEMRAVSLKQITGKSFDPYQLAKELVNNILARFEQAVATPDRIHESYNTVLYCREQTVRLKKGNIAFNAEILEVNQAGQLLTNVGAFDNGEISWDLPVS